ALCEVLRCRVSGNVSCAYQVHAGGGPLAVIEKSLLVLSGAQSAQDVLQRRLDFCGGGRVRACRPAEVQSGACVDMASAFQKEWSAARFNEEVRPAVGALPADQHIVAEGPHRCERRGCVAPFGVQEWLAPRS